MKKIVGLAFLLALPACAAAPAAVDVTGSWELSGEVQGTQVVETCQLTQTDVVIAGSCTTSTGKYDTKGKVDGKTVTFSHGGKYEGSDLVITYTGKLADDGSLSGTMDVDPFSVTGSFTAKKGAAAPAGK